MGMRRVKSGFERRGKMRLMRSLSLEGFTRGGLHTLVWGIK